MNDNPAIMKKQARKPAYKKSDAVKLLEKLANAAARAKYPNMPHLAPRLYRDDSANSLTKCIIDWLRLNGQQAERINSTGRYVDNSRVVSDITGSRKRIGSGKWIPGSGQKGTADISATIKGRSVKIEVKIKDKQSQDQKNYQLSVERAGGEYWLVRSFEEFLMKYKNTEAPPRTPAGMQVPDSPGW